MKKPISLPLGVRFFPYSDSSADELLRAFKTLKDRQKKKLLSGRPISCISIGPQKRTGWSGTLEVYLVFCRTHNALTMTHGQGHDERLECGACRKEFHQRSRDAISAQKRAYDKP